MQKKTSKKMFRSLFFLLVFVLCIGIAGWYYAHKNVENGVGERKTQFHAHYAFIAGDMEDRQWKNIYQEMQNKGTAKGVYVECMNDSFPQEYTSVDYMNIAVSMKVDGIILEGKDDPALQEAVDQAVDSGIPVVT